jgi:hypothetical protein
VTKTAAPSKISTKSTKKSDLSGYNLSTSEDLQAAARKAAAADRETVATENKATNEKAVVEKKAAAKKFKA